MHSIVLTRIAAAALLVGFGAHRWLMAQKPVDAATYHARVREAAQHVPDRIGAWVGNDVPMPPSEVAALRPNVAFSRQYTNVETGTSVRFLFLHCSDVRDVAGHHPPRCYSGRGWSRQGAYPREWIVGDLEVKATEYPFSMSVLGRSRSILVIDCLLLPNGIVSRDLDGMIGTLSNMSRHYFGAGRIQLCFDGNVTPEQRHQAVVALIGGYRPVIDAILANVPN